MSSVSETQAGRQGPGWRPLKWKIALTSQSHPHGPTSPQTSPHKSSPLRRTSQQCPGSAQGGNLRTGLAMGQEESQEVAGDIFRVPYSRKGRGCLSPPKSLESLLYSALDPAVGAETAAEGTGAEGEEGTWEALGPGAGRSRGSACAGFFEGRSPSSSRGQAESPVLAQWGRGPRQGQAPCPPQLQGGQKVPSAQRALLPAQPPSQSQAWAQGRGLVGSPGDPGRAGGCSALCGVPLHTPGGCPSPSCPHCFCRETSRATGRQLPSSGHISAGVLPCDERPVDKLSGAGGPGL